MPIWYNDGGTNCTGWSRWNNIANTWCDQTDAWTSVTTSSTNDPLWIRVYSRRGGTTYVPFLSRADSWTNPVITQATGYWPQYSEDFSRSYDRSRWNNIPAAPPIIQSPIVLRRRERPPVRVPEDITPDQHVAAADIARRRARELLLNNLTPEQRETFEKNGWFIVEGGRTKQRYRIHGNMGISANIDVLNGERRTHRLCAHCSDYSIPIGDHLLAQKLMLEASEDEFLRMANRHAA